MRFKKGSSSTVGYHEQLAVLGHLLRCVFYFALVVSGGAGRLHYHLPWSGGGGGESWASSPNVESHAWFFLDDDTREAFLVKILSLVGRIYRWLCSFSTPSPNFLSILVFPGSAAASCGVCYHLILALWWWYAQFWAPSVLAKCYDVTSSRELLSCWVCSRRNTLLTTRFCLKTLHVFDISTRRQGASVNQTVRCLTTRYFPSCGGGGRTITVSLRWILKGTGFKVRMILVFRHSNVLART